MRKKTENRLIRTMAAALIVTVSLTACGGNAGSESGGGREEDGKENGMAAQPGENSNFNAEGLPIVNEPEEFTIFYAPSSGLPTRTMDEKEFFKRAEQETNIKINWIEVPNSSATEKINIIMNSGELPDAILGTAMSTTLLADSIEAGQVRAIDDLLEYAPNTKKILDNYPEARNGASYAGDGKLYFFPGIRQENYSRTGNPMFINKTWLDNLHLDMPGSVEELKAVFEAFKTQDPNGNGIADEIPMGMCKAWFGLEVYRMYPLWEMQPPIMCPVDASIRDGKLEYNPVSENFRDYIKFMSECYANGWLEAESLTQDNNTLKAKASEEPARYGFFFAWTPDMVVGVDLQDQYELLPPLESPYGRTMFNCTADTKPVQISAGLTILKDCKNPEALARWYDYFMDGVNSLELYAGEEGIGWVKDDETKTWYVNSAKLSELGVSFDEYRSDYAVQTPLGAILPEIIGYECVEEENSVNEIKERWSKVYDPYAMSLDEVWPYVTPIATTTEQSQEIALLHTDLKNYIDTFVADVIVKGYTDEKWEAHLQEVEKYRYKEIMEYYQELYDQYKY